MSAERDRRRNAERTGDGAQATLAPSTADPAAARVLALQRGAGNTAVAALLARRKGQTEAPRTGGWNEKPQDVGGTIRIPVSGVTSGYKDDDPQFGQTTESAAGRAVLIVPRGLDVTKQVDALLFFHGMGNAGYRERTADHDTRGKAGTVHDVEADRIPQQIDAAGGKLVAVLPQGSNKANFFIADPQAYVQEVLTLATADYRKRMGKADATLTAGHVIVSGHSGGGRAAVTSVKKLDRSGTPDEWATSPPLMLFDGINGTAELENVATWVEGWLSKDLAMLSAAPQPLDLLKRRKLKLLSTFTAGGRYQALNDKGTYVDDSGNTITISARQGLRGRIKRWFETHKVDPTYVEELKQQYVIDGPVAGGHENTVGTGRTPEGAKEKRLPAPSGLDGASKAAGVPDYKGGGNLDKGLKKLYPKRRVVARDAYTDQLEADWNDAQYAGSQGKFKGEGRPPGSPKERYLKLAPLYRARGIDRPLKWAHENITEITFFGAKTPGHVTLQTALGAAELALRVQGITERPFKSCWAFNPRTTTKGGWSNHADGKAIDIDADSNPHLLDLRQKKIINAVTGMDVTAQGTSYDVIAEMSRTFQERYTPEGMEQRIAELEADERELAAEEAAIGDELKAIPKRKRGRLTAEERKAAAENEAKAKELTKALKAKHGQVAKAQERQKLLGGELKRYEKTDAAAGVQRQKIADLITEIEEIEKALAELGEQITAAEQALDAKPDPKTLGKAERKARAAEDKAARAQIRKDRTRMAKLGKDRRAKQRGIAQAEARIDPLHRWGDDGFMDLRKELVTTLQAAGLSWGGEWGGSKDFMHFEVPPTR